MRDTILTLATIGGLIAAALIVAVPTAATECQGDPVAYVCATVDSQRRSGDDFKQYVQALGRHWSRASTDYPNGFLYVDGNQEDSCSTAELGLGSCWTWGDADAHLASGCYTAQAETWSAVSPVTDSILMGDGC